MRLLYLLFIINWISFAHATPILVDPQDRFSPTLAKQGMVVASESFAAQASLEVLKQGGNAVDAAVTLGFAMAVTAPRAGNLGGGGFMLVYDAETQKVVAIDYREKAPALAHKDMYLDQNGDVDAVRSKFTHLAAGVPGTVAGLALALEKYGTISLQQALQPAIQLATDGFPMPATLANAIQDATERFQRSAASRAIFMKPDGSFYQAGELFKQADLAKTLRLLAEQGTDAFYHGKIADQIVAEMQANQGIISKTDLANYQPQIRQPIQGNYRGYDVFSMSPPSSGGVHIVQMLNMLEQFDIKQTGHNSAQTIHIMTEAMKRAYADRSQYLGDTDFVSVPLQGLTHKDYAKQLTQQFDLQKATLSQNIREGQPAVYESPETTHYSIVDKHGNAVANTYTLNFSFGSGITVSGAGFLLNNEMDDFSAKPNVPNAYGLIGGTANAIEPHKRMLSSMSPTIVLKDNKPFLVTGSPGGSRIITAVLQVILNVIDHDMNIQEAVNAARIHHQWLPDKIFMENGLSPDTVDLLKQKGHRLEASRTMGATNSILIQHTDDNKRILNGAADPRRPEAIVASY
ncbi:gamma-glutamyltransferase [Candidatus Albibeggiatoa sp. nov. NOAA]|uniref:gamma-glutamyltransferase n=1 Tax=Candidatus Albibeggiatoa sp. nov. NOAA TaxID=3162724 RepID=UPI00330386D5|nr:gamma-glutamyltransferase [Thiotrichaceae bacterium]